MTRTRLALILAFLLLVGVAFWLLLPGKDKQAPTPSTNPFGGTSAPVSNTPVQQGGQIVLSDGTAIAIPDLTSGKTPTELPGATYYEITENDSTTEGRFTVVYGTDGSIAVQLLAEPLRDARTAAEYYLRDTFKLTDRQLCSAQVTVAVPNHVNEYFSGRNLGLSFCSESEQLP